MAEPMGEAYRAYEINMDCACGFAFGEQVMQEIRHEVYEVLKRHVDELKRYSWTLNKTYAEDGRQVSIAYESDDGWSGFHDKDALVRRVLTCNSIDVRSNIFTDRTDRESVEELCRMVATGELTVSGVMK